MLHSDSLAQKLRRSLELQEEQFYKSLILNPVENLPFEKDIEPASGFLHGLYNTDKLRSPEAQRETIHQFAGRSSLAVDSREIYSAWAEALGAADVSMRLLSGLHAHTAIFMAMSSFNQTVLLLPEVAGGHMCTKAILNRLGLNVIDMEVDAENCRVDIDRTRKIIKRESPDFIFIDRSEGLVFEDFSPLIHDNRSISVFDGSQYLSNLIAGDHPSPFSVGFDFLVSTLHKNFPGPQKALVAARKKDATWEKTLKGLSAFVSNMHVYGTYSAGLTLGRSEWLKNYSNNMLQNALALEALLAQRGVKVVERPKNLPPTHHLWLPTDGKHEAFSFFQNLESCGLQTNYRKLPYNIGYGLRLGTSFITRIGISSAALEELADVIANISKKGALPRNKSQAESLIARIWADYFTQSIDN